MHATLQHVLHLKWQNIENRTHNWCICRLQECDGYTAVFEYDNYACYLKQEGPLEEEIHYTNVWYAKKKSKKETYYCAKNVQFVINETLQSETSLLRSLFSSWLVVRCSWRQWRHHVPNYRRGDVITSTSHTTVASVKHSHNIAHSTTTCYVIVLWTQRLWRHCLHTHWHTPARDEGRLSRVWRHCRFDGGSECRCDRQHNVRMFLQLRSLWVHLHFDRSRRRRRERVLRRTVRSRVLMINILSL